MLAGADGQSATVRDEFSHLGEPATGPNTNHIGGLECSACHAGWHNMRYGNHIGLNDMKDGQRIYDWDRITGETTLGARAFFDWRVRVRDPCEPGCDRLVRLVGAREILGPVVVRCV